MVQFYQSGYDFASRRWTHSLPDGPPPDCLPLTPLPTHVDVLVVGTGPAGLLLSAQLARHPHISAVTIEQRPSRLTLGQADGLQTRTLETFQAFGFADRVLREAYHVNETTFWADGKRTGRTKDTRRDASEFPHVILNQARVHDFFLDAMWESARRKPAYGCRLLKLERLCGNAEDPAGANVQATIERTDASGATHTHGMTARYVVGADGAHSAVRHQIGQPMRGDSNNHAWGVMDVLLQTDFPDIRFKSAISSSSEGICILIPREGGFLVRLYIELGMLQQGQRAGKAGLTQTDLIAKASRIFTPFALDIKEVVWWSVYEIGQRVADRFDDGADDAPGRAPVSFIMGDACHTHSPKAGQGMNVSMADAFNLGWKLVHAASGWADAAPLLQSYSQERNVIARDLIDFDRRWNAVLDSAKQQDATLEESSGKTTTSAKSPVQAAYEQQAQYVEGLATQYAPSRITADARACRPELARGFPVGMRLQSSPVLRCFDARTVQLGHTMTAEAKWHVLIFGGAATPGDASSAPAKLCRWLDEDPRSPVVRVTPASGDRDAVVDVKAVLTIDHTELDVREMPSILRPLKGRLRLRDHEKVFCDRWAAGERIPSIYEERGIDAQTGCVVIVRPDQYVAAVYELLDFEKMAGFFDGIFSN